MVVLVEVGKMKEGGNNSIPKYSKPEPVEDTKRRIQMIDEWICMMDESSDFEDECESVIQLFDRVQEETGLSRAAKTTCRDQGVKKDVAQIKNN